MASLLNTGQLVRSGSYSAVYGAKLENLRWEKLLHFVFSIVLVSDCYCTSCWTTQKQDEFLGWLNDEASKICYRFETHFVFRFKKTVVGRRRFLCQSLWSNVRTLTIKILSFLLFFGIMSWGFLLLLSLYFRFFLSFKASSFLAFSVLLFCSLVQIELIILVLCFSKLASWKK